MEFHTVKNANGRYYMLNNVYPVNHHAIIEMVKLLKLKGYSDNTIKTYQNKFAQFLIALKG